MKFTQHIKHPNGQTTKYSYLYMSKDEMIQIVEGDFNSGNYVATWADDEFGKELVYFDKHTQLIKGEKKLKKRTKEKVLDEINNRVWTKKEDIEEVLDSLEKQGYIEFKKEPKTYKVFVKIVTIDGEDKKLYYVTDFNLTDNIDEAKRFEVDEEKDSYAYEFVKEY